jgi:hypothetical protein
MNETGETFEGSGGETAGDSRSFELFEIHQRTKEAKMVNIKIQEWPQNTSADQARKENRLSLRGRVIQRKERKWNLSKEI